MRIEGLDEGDADGRNEEELELAVDDAKTSFLQAKRAVVGIGARALFYPTLMYNVINNKIRPGFHWWDEVDKFLLLGAVPFPGDVPHLKQLGVCGVITLNEPYETLVPTSLYAAHGIEHLVIPTRDYLFAPSFEDICQAVDFIHKNVSSGRTTYVHCKAGRGRSTTIVICYLVQYKHMPPNAAYTYIKQSRPRVLLASSQWQAVLRYYHLRVNTIGSGRYICFGNSEITPPMFQSATKFVGFDDTSFIVVSQADLDGYNDDDGASNVDSRPWVELSLVCRAQFAGLAALAKLSGFWIRCNDLRGKALPCMVAEDCRLKEAGQFGKLESLLAVK